MEFEEMKRIWDQQNDEPLYAINEAALHRSIREKKKRAGYRANFNEIALIIANIAAAAIILLPNPTNQDIYSYLLVGLMVITSAFIFVWRMERKRKENTFDQSIAGDLDNAIANATLQVRLSQIMRWYIVVVYILVALAKWQSSNSIWFLFLIVLIFSFTWFAGRLEHQCNVRKKRELETLRDKLTDMNDIG